MCFSENRLIDGDLRRDALSLQKSGDWDDQGPQAADAIGAESGGTSAMNRWELRACDSGRLGFGDENSG